MSSSTSRRSRVTSWISSSAGRRASTGIRSTCSRRSDASPTSAVSGVRSSWDTSEVNRRSRAWASESALIFASRASAISLNDVAQAPNSSCPSTGSLVASSPSAIERAARLARATGSRVRLASERPTSPARSTTTTHPTSSTLRSCARSR